MACRRRGQEMARGIQNRKWPRGDRQKKCPKAEALGHVRDRNLGRRQAPNLNYSLRRRKNSSLPVVVTVTELLTTPATACQFGAIRSVADSNM